MWRKEGTNKQSTRWTENETNASNEKTLRYKYFPRSDFEVGNIFVK